MHKTIAFLSGVVLLSAGGIMPAAANEAAVLIADAHEMAPMVVEGTVVDIVGNRVRVRPADGGAEEFYDINRETQVEAGLDEGSIIRLTLVDEEIVMVEGPGGQVQLAEMMDMEMMEEMSETEEVVEMEMETVERTVVEETTVMEEETMMVEEETMMMEEEEAVVEMETPEPIRALW